MKIILVGYTGSQLAAKIAKYLNGKYIGLHYDYTYLNYDGPIEGWSKYVAGYLSYLQDEKVVFALDDYLVADIMDGMEFYKAIYAVSGDTVCAKLCHCSAEENEEYPVTTQYTIWNREYLIWLLSQVNTPWEFEVKGSRLFDKKFSYNPCLKYFTNSSVSSRWKGIRLDGLCEEDVEYIRNTFKP